MDRILTFKEKKCKFVDALIPFVADALNSIKYVKNSSDNDESDLKGAVLGDASGSMEVAIKSSSIIASLLFILVSDEQENECVNDVDGAIASASGGGKNNGNNNNNRGKLWFDDIFHKYLRDINPNAKVFLVSFLSVGENGVIHTKILKRNELILNRPTQRLNILIKKSKNEYINVKIVEEQKRLFAIKQREKNRNDWNKNKNNNNNNINNNNNNVNTPSLDDIMKEQSNEMGIGGDNANTKQDKAKKKRRR